MDAMEPPVTERPIELDVRLPTGASAPASARALVGGLRERLADDVLEDLVLAVSEIVTNCVRHAGLGPDQDISVCVRATSGGVRLEVIDGGRGFDRPDVVVRDPAHQGGWGLYIVDRIADRWGVVRESGTRLWLEIDTGPDGRRSLTDADLWIDPAAS
ncbi:MAG TPA: ATP-binding protein [Actinomycetota bacterium]|jgi:anti-sigma regulatory factor (Ser/Thr protein kinase)